jgi:PAS domain S-box-containing protein
VHAIPGKAMAGKTSSKLRLRLYSWPTVAVALLLIQAVLSVTIRQSVALTAYTLIIYFLVLVLAAGLATLNAVQSSEAIRLFWSFLAMAFGVWSLSACSWVYYKLVLGRDRPTYSMGLAVPLVLHIVFMIAAVASRPHLKLSPHRGYRATLNFLVLVFFWLFAYAFLWVPHSSTDWNVVFALRGQALYLVENFLLLLVLGILIVRAQLPWKSIYRHLLGASALYILGSSIANYLLAYRGMYLGLKDIPYMAAGCWFVWVALQGRKLAPQLAQSAQLEAGDTKYTSLLAMLSVLTVPAVGVWELLLADEPYRIRVIRLLIVLLSVLLLSVFVFVLDFFTNRELSSDVGLANERLRLAVEAGKSLGWDWDVKSGRNTWLGDLQDIFGIRASNREGHINDFRRRIHPDDQELVWEAVDDAKHSRKPYGSEFRIVMDDGTVRWIAARGKFYYAPNGDAERMVGMAVDVTERRQAETAIRDSEERFRLVANTAPVLIWSSRTDTLCDFFNRPWLEFTGRSLEHELGNGWAQGVHPEDFDRCLQIYLSSFHARKPFSMEYRLRRADGEFRWVFDSGVPRYTPDGQFAGYIGSCIDITERKQTEQEREELSGRLINAQEQERSRLARELHDDFNQRLAILAIDLERTAEMISTSPSEASKRMLELWNRASEIGADLHSLSHRLHSSTLESLGLVLGVSSFCAEFAEQQGIQVDFAHENIPGSIPPDVALCLFRIVQEGLRNVKKHSGASRAEVQLTADAEAIRLSLSDNGAGFNFAETSATVGLGIRSIQERLRLVGGVFEIGSRRMQGTQIAASVPLKSSVAPNSSPPAPLLVEVHSLHPAQVTSLDGKGGGL